MAVVRGVPGRDRVGHEGDAVEVDVEAAAEIGRVVRDRDVGGVELRAAGQQDAATIRGGGITADRHVGEVVGAGAIDFDAAARRVGPIDMVAADRHAVQRYAVADTLTGRAVNPSAEQVVASGRVVRDGGVDEGEFGAAVLDRAAADARLVGGQQGVGDRQGAGVFEGVAVGGATVLQRGG